MWKKQQTIMIWQILLCNNLFHYPIHQLWTSLVEPNSHFFVRYCLSCVSMIV
jgi:hypothetical protein